MFVDDMKTMSDYTIFCTIEQTKKALELGAPIQYASIKDIRLERYVYVGEEWYTFPTAEQMIGWLEEKHIDVFVGKQTYARFVATVCVNDELIYSQPCKSRPEATIAAINAALEYLTNSNNYGTD